MTDPTLPLLAVDGVKVHFPIGHRRPWSRDRQVVHAVDGVSLQIGRGETVGLIGESGSGKSTLSRTVMGVHRPTEGRVLLGGVDVHRARGEAARSARRRMQMIFQNPYSSVNRRYTVEQIIGEPLHIHRAGTASQRAARIRELLDQVGLSASLTHRYPHELSGGQLQRVGIARALSVKPELLIADEPTAALDVSVRAQVMNLLVDLKESMGLTLLFISHDLATVSYVADRICVLYLGRLVESAETTELERLPLHPYTESLLAAVPRPDPDANRIYRAPTGEIPSAINPPPACSYHPRCSLVEDVCRVEYPVVTSPSPSRTLTCHVRGHDQPRLADRKLDGS